MKMINEKKYIINYNIIVNALLLYEIIIFRYLIYRINNNLCVK